MNESSSNGTSISKKRKITHSASQFQSSEMKHQLPNSLAEAAENIISSASAVVSDEFRSENTPLLTCLSSGKVTETDDDDVKDLNTTPLDPEVCYNFHLDQIRRNNFLVYFLVLCFIYVCVPLFFFFTNICELL